MKLVKYGSLSLLVVIVLIFSVACQATPNKVEYKKKDSVVLPSGLYTKKVTITDGIRLSFSAQVSATNSPIICGTFKAAKYTDELIQKTYSAICADKQPFQYCETAQSLFNYVAYGKESLDLLKETLPQEIYEQEQSELDSILEIAKTAPEERVKGDLSHITNYEQGLIQVDMGGAEAAQFQVLTSPRYIIYYSNYQLPKVSSEPCLEPLKISQSEAVSIANNVLSEIGVDNDFSLVRVNKEVINYAYYQTYFDDKTKNEAFVLLYLRQVNHSNQLDDSRVLLGTDNQYDLSFIQEYILIKIDDKGILSFNWNTPGELILTNEPESVITFDDAVSIATNQMKVSFTKYTFEGAAPADINVCIDKIALGYIFCEGTGNTVDVLPAWEFYGYIVDESKSEGNDRYYDVNTKSWTDSYEDNVSLCVINALNGKVIDRIGKY